MNVRQAGSTLEGMRRLTLCLLFISTAAACSAQDANSSDPDSAFSIVAVTELRRLVFIGGDDLCHDGIDGAAVGDLFQAFCFDDAVSRAFTVPHGLKHLFGNLVGDSVVHDEAARAEDAAAEDGRVIGDDVVFNSGSCAVAGNAAAEGPVAVLDGEASKGSVFLCSTPGNKKNWNYQH